MRLFHSGRHWADDLAGMGIIIPLLTTDASSRPGLPAGLSLPQGRQQSQRRYLITHINAGLQPRLASGIASTFERA